MEPETKLEAMTYLVSFMYHSLTHSLTTSVCLFPPFQYPSPCLPAFFGKRNQETPFY